MLTRSLFILAAMLATVMYGDEFTIPLDSGHIVIENFRFIRIYGKTYIPEMSFSITNKSGSEWENVHLEFNIRCICGTQPRPFKRVVHLGRLPYGKDYKELVDSLVGEVDGCRLDGVTGKILLAFNDKWRIDGVTGERTD